MNFSITGNTKEEVLNALMEKFSLGKTSVYKRFTQLDIGITKHGGAFGITQEDLDNMQGLEDWIKDGKIISSYPAIANKSAIIQSNGGKLDEAATYLHSEEVDSNGEHLQLIMEGYKKGAGVLIAQNLIAQQCAANPNLLPDDLRQAVYRSEAAIAPKSQSLTDYANQFLEFMNPQESQAA
jgi:hypothetical protein